MCEKEYSFQNINIEECINKSFTEFVNENQIEFPNLSNKILEKWNFEEYLEKNNILPNDLSTNPALIESIPDISTIKPNDSINEKKLIKFFGTIQNTNENQLYISAKYDSENKTYLINKYFENNSNKMILEEDNLSNQTGTDVLGDRLRLELIPVIGMNEYFTQKINLDENIKQILVYDYSNKFTKINQNILVLGVAYHKEDKIIIHAWKILGDYEKIKICNDYNSLIKKEINDDKKIYREKLKNILLKIVKNDKIASEYLLLFLFGQIFSKLGTKNVGAFPLNLILEQKLDKNQCDTIYNNILNTYRKICLKILDIKLTTDELNKELYYPRFDTETEILNPGKLQLSDGTFLLIDEINMNEGKLVETGIKNIGTLKNLVDFQLIGYEYPYNKVEICHDLEIMVVTQKSKSILFSPFLTLLPMITAEDDANAKSTNLNDLTENDFKSIFYYLNFIRYDSYYNDKFTIDDEISKSIQNDYISRNKNFKPDDFDLVLKLARFHALSYGRNNMTYEDYEYVVYLENERKDRVSKFIPIKNK